MFNILRDTKIEFKISSIVSSFSDLAPLAEVEFFYFKRIKEVHVDVLKMCNIAKTINKIK